MDAIAFGGLLLSLPRLYAFTCALALLLAAHHLLPLSSRQRTGWANGALLSWLITARLVHAWLNLEAYQDAPLTVLMLWQPGYNTAGGLLAALLWTLWYLRATRRSCLVAVTLVLAAHGAWYALGSWRPLGEAPGLSRLPSLKLENIDGRSVALDAFSDRPTLISLWASGCPPCRREMPLLATLDHENNVTVIIANQGESLLQMLRFFDERRLDFHHALLDPQQRLLALSHAPGLPVTLLFDEGGRLMKMHIGELTYAQWQKWQRLLDESSSEAPYR